jgi:hypothetical protein
MAGSEIEWPYANMTGMSSVDGTVGVFQFTTKAEWKIAPDESGRRADYVLKPFKLLLGRSPKLGHDAVFSTVGSIHRNTFDIRSTGVSSCHVRMIDSISAKIYADFDLPSTPEDEFVAALERIGEAKIEHPYFDNDRNQYQENVTLDGVTTRVNFVPK